MQSYRRPLIGNDDNEPGMGTSGTLVWRIFLTIGIAAGIVALIIAAVLMAWNADNIKRIQGVPPTNNEVHTLEGPGIAITPDVPTSSLTFANTGVLSNIAGAGIAVSSATGDVTISNTGVLTVNTRGPISGDILLSPGLGIAISNGVATNQIDFANTGVLTVNSRVPLVGNILFSPGNGISITNGGGSNEIDVANTGVLSNIAGTGMTVSGATGDVTITHTLAAQTLLDDTDANGPQVSYAGVVSAGAVNTWVLSTLNVIDAGQGNVGGTAWQVPASGLYDVRASCVTPFNRTDYEAIHLAISFGATTDNPETDGYVPIGGRTFSRVGYEKEAYLNVGSLVHTGCTNCPVPNGAGLKVHAYLENQIYATTLDLICSVQIGRVF